MTKEQISVHVGSEEERLRVIEILERLVEPIDEMSRLWDKDAIGYVQWLGTWALSVSKWSSTKLITIDEFEALLTPKRIRLTIEEATQQYKDFMNEQGYNVEIVITEK